jgi:stage IV sporulation protein FB
MFGEPAPSSGDLHFRAFGIPVRVSPMFWLVTVIMGLRTDEATPPAELLIWIVVVFVSILIHELGHAFAQRWYGGHPWITLYGMGGLAACDDCDRRTWSQILISLAGPGAGFLLALATGLALRATGTVVGVAPLNQLQSLENEIGAFFAINLPGAAVYWQPLDSPLANDLVGSLFFINILWGLVNLLPVYPLDGGRVARELATIRDVPSGIVLSLRISMVTAIGMALFAAFAWRSIFVAALFGYMAYANYQTLNHYEQSRW